MKRHLASVDDAFLEQLFRLLSDTGELRKKFSDGMGNPDLLTPKSREDREQLVQGNPRFYSDLLNELKDPRASFNGKFVQELAFLAAQLLGNKSAYLKAVPVRLAPTWELNGCTVEAPNGGAVILLDDSTLWILQTLVTVYSALDSWHSANPLSHEHSEEDCERTLLFLGSYCATGDMRYLQSAPAFLWDSVSAFDDRIISMTVAIEMFLLLHEYGHVYLHHKANPAHAPEAASVETDVAINRFQYEQEFAADAFALEHLVKGLGSDAFAAPSLLLALFRVAELHRAREQPEWKPTHPAAIARWQRLLSLSSVASVSSGHANKIQDRFTQLINSYEAQSRGSQAAELHSAATCDSTSSDSATLIRSAWSSFHAGNYLAAIESAETARRSDQRDASVNHCLAVSHCQLGHLELALLEINKSIRLRQGVSAAHCDRGNILRDIGAGSSALDEYSRAIALDAENFHAHLNRGIALHNKKLYREAISDLDVAVRLKPESATAHFSRGLSYHCVGQYDAALTDFDKTLRIDADHVEVRHRRANTNVALGRHREAASDYDCAFAKSPCDPRLWYDHACYLCDNGELERALASYDKALTLDTTFEQAYVNRATVQMQLGNWAEAQADLETALTYDGGDALAHMNLASVYAVRGSMQAAREHVELAIKYGNASIVAMARRLKEQLRN